MKKRQQNIIIVCIWIASFLLLSPSTVQAYFSDINSIDTGIKITLGSIDLEVDNSANTQELKLGNGVTEIDIRHKVLNKGTLEGKLAYKINAKKADGTDIDDSLLKSLKITVNNQELNMNSINQYSPVSTQEGDDFYLTPGEKAKEISMKVKLTSDIQQTQTINLEVEYMLFQTNGTIEKPLFCDSVNLNHKIILDKKDDFWPSKPIKSGDYQYAIDMPETFYFSNKEKSIFVFPNYYTSINHGTFYLESTKKVTDWGNVVRWKNADSVSYKVEPISEYRAKVYFYFNKEIDKDDKEKNFYFGETTFELKDDRNWSKIPSKLQQYTAKKLLVSKDSFNTKTGKITENTIDLSKSLNEVLSIQYVDKISSNQFERKEVELGHSIMLNANLYVGFFILPDIAEPVQVIGNSKIPLLNSLNPSQNLWTIIKKIIADISDNYNPQLQIILKNSTTNQSVVLYRNLSNILQLQSSGRAQQTFSRQNRSLTLNNENSNEPSPLLIEESVPKDSNSSAENQPKVTKEKIPAKQPDKENPKNTEDSNHKPPVVNEEDSDAEIPVPVEEKEEIPQESTEKVPEIIEEEESSHLPTEEKFSYLEVKVKDKSYEIGITQEQLNWLMKFKTVQEFTDEVNNEADALFIKYDRIKGIENVETFINQLAEIEQLDATLEVKDHPKRKVVEIKIIK